MPTQHTRAGSDKPPATHHLSVRPDNAGPAEVHFLFERSEKRLGGAVGASMLTHGGMVGLWMLLVWLGPEPVREALLPDALSRQIVWLAEPGPGGGGGGGNKRPEPPKKAELPGKEKISVPVKPEPKPEPEPEKPPEESLTIPAKTIAAATDTSPGLIESTSTSA